VRYLLLLGVMSVGCTSIGGNLVAVRSAMQRDLEGYAIASCLVKSGEPYLKDQGDGWGAVIVQRSKADLAVLSGISEAVNREVAKGNMAVIRHEGESARDKQLPVLYCSEIIDSAVVRSAIARAADQASSSYGE
jgi:hypothetical protein